LTNRQQIKNDNTNLPEPTKLKSMCANEMIKSAVEYSKVACQFTDKQQRLYASLSLRASPHLLPQSLQKTSYTRNPLDAIVLADAALHLAR